MKIFFKALRLVRSYFTLIKFKIRYGSSFKFHFSDRVPSSLIIRLDNGGKITFGKDVIIRENCVINCTGGLITLGDSVFLNDMVCINSREKVDIGSGTIIGQSVKIYDHDHDYKHELHTDFICSSVEIGTNVWLGSNVVVLRGSRIGENCVVGACSLVKGTIESEHIYYNKRTPIMVQIEKSKKTVQYNLMKR